MNKEQRSPHGDNQESGHLPIYGVGPYYGVGIILLTVTGIVLSVAGVLDSGKITNTILMVTMIFLGILLLVEGFLVWKSAAIGKNSVDNYIKKMNYAGQGCIVSSEIPVIQALCLCVRVQFLLPIMYGCYSFQSFFGRQ